MPSIVLEIGFHQPGDGRVARFQRFPLVIGRGDECKLRFNHDVVSRKHAELYFASDGCWYLVDAESANGTFLNGREIRSARIGAEDVIQIGREGPRCRILALDPPAQGERPATPPAQPHTRREATPARRQADPRERRPARREGKKRSAPREAKRRPASPPAVKKKRRGIRFPWLAALGLIAGAAIGHGLLPDPFPYTQISAPAMLASVEIGRLAPEFWTSERLSWLLLLLLSFEGGSLGLALHRLRFGFLWILALGAAHAWTLLNLSELLPT